MPSAPSDSPPRPVADPSPGAAVPSLIRALRHRNYQLFFGGQLISLIGTWMQTVAQSWLVYRLTGSSLLLGAVGFSSQIPVFLLATVGGVVADRKSCRIILLATQSASMLLALALAALTLTGHIHVAHLIVLGALLGVVNAFDLPARQVIAIQLVGKEDLMNAIALNSVMFNGARIVGPAVAGILVSAIGEGYCFLANGLSFLAVIAGLWAMRLPPARARSPHGSAIADILAGFRFASEARAIRALMLLLGLVSLTAFPYVVLMPIFADRILHGGARGLGILMGATGGGAFFGGIALATRTGLRGLGSWIAFATALMGVALIIFGFSQSFWLSALVLVPMGFATMLMLSGSNTLIQSMVPDAMRGRIMALYAMMFMGMAPLGSLLAGALADRVGAPVTVAAGGVSCLIAAAVFALHLPSLRAGARELIIGNAGGVEPPP